MPCGKFSFKKSNSSLLSSLKRNAKILNHRLKIRKTPIPPPAIGIRDENRIRFWDNYNKNIVMQISRLQAATT